MRLAKEILIVLIAGIAVVGFVVFAGTDIFGPAGTPSATNVTLDDIYAKLTNTSIASKTFYPQKTTTEGNFRDLKQLYDLLTPISSTTITSSTTIMGVAGAYNISNLTPDKVATGTTYGTSSVGTLQ